MSRRDLALVAAGWLLATIGIVLAALLYGCGGGCPRATTATPNPDKTEPCPRR